MRIMLAIIAAIAMTTAASAAPRCIKLNDDPDIKAIMKALGVKPTPIDLWKDEMKCAPDKAAKLALLEEAWGNRFAPDLSQNDRNAWTDAWTEAYRREALQPTMPNPYEDGH